MWLEVGTGLVDKKRRCMSRTKLDSEIDLTKRIVLYRKIVRG